MLWIDDVCSKAVTLSEEACIRGIQPVPKGCVQKKTLYIKDIINVFHPDPVGPPREQCYKVKRLLQLETISEPIRQLENIWQPPLQRGNQRQVGDWVVGGRDGVN